MKGYLIRAIHKGWLILSDSFIDKSTPSLRDARAIMTPRYYNQAFEILSSAGIDLNN